MDIKFSAPLIKAFLKQAGRKNPAVELHDAIRDIVDSKASMNRLKRCFGKLAKRLIANADIDPIYKAEYAILWHSYETYVSYERGKPCRAISTYLDSCIRRYDAVRVHAYKSAKRAYGLSRAEIGKLPRSYVEFVQLPRSRRIMIQDVVLCAQHCDAEITRNIMARESLKHGSKRILNVGDSPPYSSTFLKHLIAECAINPTVRREIVTVDVARNTMMLGRSKHLQKLSRNIRLSFVRGDAKSMELGPHLYDLVVASLMIDDCADQDALLENIYKALRPRGIFYLSGHHCNHNNRFEKYVYNFEDPHVNQTNSDNMVKLAVKRGFKVYYRYANEHAWVLGLVRNEGTRKGLIKR